MIIETKNLVKVYGQRKVVDDVSLTVEQGTIVGLLGPNGAGKTTTFYMVVGIAKPDSGVVLLDGHDIGQMPMYQRARMGIGYLPQEASVFRKMTVEENLMSILETTSLSREEQVKKMDELIEEFGIGHIRKNLGTALSGGERRRVEIARSLATDPAFILLDEPFAGIDPIAVADIQGMIAHLAKRGIGILITDHNVRETLSIVDKAYILASGKVLLHGDSESIAKDPIARKYYLGENFRM
ncbi:MAG: LPS export ABC transporter ATP-binding protein [Acidaminococcaceae bacterium]|nr:LPS export ABC transporter ATP-binding protein [Acidaminococcaceae bacterium]MBO5604334.1 LPS export ABC transporter ATP-binding protein [Acidaminococcaceae bacterium]MBO6182382.1 LPS export ABC transporter ATP-binding protein [Acidaminococcaceae bacterium]MBO6265046.1 LPS export ABC transporter ATP-binding protein [Acidaminococcaceae bacterium]MBP3264843.1 LPS export ABC transporter ATP-binding protein [Acidaminococcaceae bacterium]